MNLEAQKTVACSSRKQADLYIQKGNVGRAFAHLLVALKLSPHWKSELKDRFSSTLCSWGKELESQKRYSDLFNCYEQALEVFADNEDVINNLGAHLFRLGCLKESIYFFTKALETNPKYVQAICNLDSVKNILVERWHFRMLNDSHRNCAYREALIKKVRQGYFSVLDIGTGTGILSLFAVEAGAKDIYACDDSSIMIEIATEVFYANNVLGKVKLIHKNSSDIKIPVDIPTRVSLIVTEIMDAGLFGENILGSLIYARKHLAVPSAAVIPAGACLWLAGIECDILTSFKHILNDEVLLIPTENEPYDTENLKKIPNEFRYLTKSIKVMDLDFNNIEQLSSYQNGKFENKCFKLKTIARGRLNTIVAWFDLHIDEDIVLTSSPLCSIEECCWDQAIFPIPFPINVVEDCEVTATIDCQGGKLSVNIFSSNSSDFHTENIKETKVLYSTLDYLNPIEKINIDMGACQVGTSANSCITLVPIEKWEDDTNPNQLSIAIPNNSVCFARVSQTSIKFLRDMMWEKGLQNILKNKHVMDKCMLLDLMPFPIVGFMMLKNCKVSKKRKHLTCIANSREEEQILRALAKRFGIDNSSLQCMQEDELISMVHMDHKFDFVLLNILETSGELSENTFNFLPKLRDLVVNDAIILPREVNVQCKLIYSESLAQMSRLLSDQKTCGYKITNFINKYQVSQHLDFYLETLEHFSCSETLDVIVISLKEWILFDDEVKLFKTKGIVTRTGFINAIPYWYKVKLSNNCPDIITVHKHSYIKQAAKIVYPDIYASEGEEFDIDVYLCNSFIHMELKLNH